MTQECTDKVKKERESTYFFQTKASLATCIDKYISYVCALTAHVYLHKYELELDVLNTFQVLLTLVCFGVFLPVLTICVPPHTF